MPWHHCHRLRTISQVCVCAQPLGWSGYFSSVIFSLGSNSTLFLGLLNYVTTLYYRFMQLGQPYSSLKLMYLNQIAWNKALIYVIHTYLTVHTFCVFAVLVGDAGHRLEHTWTCWSQWRIFYILAWYRRGTHSMSLWLIWLQPSLSTLWKVNSYWLFEYHIWIVISNTTAII